MSETPTTSGKEKKELSPLLLTILGAIATGVLAILNNFFQAKQAHDLEQDKLRSTLILKAIESPDADERKKSLKFFVEAGLLSDPEKKIERMKPENIPQAPDSSRQLIGERVSVPCGNVKVITDCPDEGCGAELNADLNKRKNIRSNEQKPIVRTIGWMKALPNPNNGDDLKKIGEGQKITVVAYALVARRGSKESCNCELVAEQDTDTHIVLVDPALKNPTLAANEYDSETAEFTPRVRLLHPNFSRAKLQPLIDGQGGRLLTRVTGQLIFDSDEVRRQRQLKRYNNWEIHPVLKMEYCPEGQTCRPDNDENWVDLD